MKTSLILDLAADLIEEKGHAHESYMDNDGKVCAVGAMRLVCGGTVVDRGNHQFRYAIDISTSNNTNVYNARRVLENYLNLDTDRISLVEWNDENDKATVVAKMREAARLEDTKEN